MKEASQPNDEDLRLRSLFSMRQLDSPVEERFERITRIAQKFFKVSISAISLVDAQRQWFKSFQGFDHRETPRNISFCAHAILSDDLFVSEDTQADVRFFDNPLVTESPFVRFYAGVPIHASDRSRIGTLCILDAHPHARSEFDFSVLKDLAALVEREFQFESPLNQAPIRHASSSPNLQLLDVVTGLWNWDGITRLLEESSQRLRLIGGDQALVWLHIDYTLPPHSSMEALNAFQRELADELLKTLDFTDTAGLITGGQFLLILNERNRDELVTRLAVLTLRIRNLFRASAALATLHHLRLSAQCDMAQHLSIADLMETIERNLPAFSDPLGTLFLSHFDQSETVQLL